MTKQFGLGRGMVFPAKRARSLLNPLRRLIQSPTRTVQRMALVRTDRVLEIGCGPGYFSRAIALAVPEGSLVLLDLQEAMLELARKRLPDLANIQFTQGDAMSLPFPDGSFDVVLLVLVLGEAPDRDRCIAEVTRVLRPGGTVTFAESRRDSDFISVGKLRAHAEKHGLQLSERRGPGWEYTARFQKSRMATIAQDAGSRFTIIAPADEPGPAGEKARAST
jgi:ubiquinone/menaquinone biosynthesis C-methylase UbiE